MSKKWQDIAEFGLRDLMDMMKAKAVHAGLDPFSVSALTPHSNGPPLVLPVLRVGRQGAPAQTWGGRVVDREVVRWRGSVVLLFSFVGEGSAGTTSVCVRVCVRVRVRSARACARPA